MTRQGRPQVESRRGLIARTGLSLGLVALLSGCLGAPKMPETLLTLTPVDSAVAGSGSTGTIASSIAVIEPAVPQKLDVKRVPVQLNAASVAYLKDAVWVEKPARLFRQMLAETIRAQGKWLVIDGIDRQFSAPTRLTGQLIDMGYDAGKQSVAVRFEAVLEGPGGTLATRRFESEVKGVAPKSGQVGTALNDAANDVARQVVAWLGSPSS